MKKHVPGCNKKLNNKWFDVNCKDARKSYHRAKRVYSNIQSADNMSCLKKSSKHYKKVIRHSVNKYKKSFNNKLRVLSLRLSNSKDYWKILCSNDKKKAITNIQTDVLTNFFKELSTDKNSDILMMNQICVVHKVIHSQYYLVFSVSALVFG